MTTNSRGVRSYTNTPHEATCIGCGCTDLRACAGGCSWLAVNRDDGTGVCSNCGKSLAAWRNQQVKDWIDATAAEETLPASDAQQSFRGSAFTRMGARMQRLRLVATRRLILGR